MSAPQTRCARALMLRYAGALPHTNPASVPNSLNVPAVGWAATTRRGSGKAQTADAICRSVVLRSNFVGDHLESCQLA
jgi:hypothetical protein